MQRRLIIGYDGSENGDDALALGAVLAGCLAATPVLAAVVPHQGSLLGSEEAGASVDEAAEPILAAGRERLGAVEAETRAIAGESPARALHEFAEDVEPVAVVVGSAHRGALGRILLGSVGAALLSGAPCAIAVAPRGYAGREKRSVLRVGVGVSGSEESWPALGAAAGLAGRVHASLTVLGVVEPVALSHGGQYPFLDPKSYERASRERFDRTLDDAIGRVPAGLPVERRLMTGDPATLIAEAAADLDLLVLGSRAFGPIRRALLGSVSAKLMGSAPCPVLVLPRSAGDDPLGLARV